MTIWELIRVLTRFNPNTKVSICASDRFSKIEALDVQAFHSFDLGSKLVDTLVLWGSSCADEPKEKE